MKRVNFLFVILMSIFLLCSCESYSQVVYTDDETEIVYSDNISYRTIITYGTPFYIDNVLSYYFYRGIYYYPYYYNNYWYFRPYRYRQPYGFRYIPHHNHRPDIRFRFHDNYNHRHYNNHSYYHRNPSMNSRPNRSFPNSSTRQNMNIQRNSSIPNSRGNIGTPQTRGGGFSGNRPSSGSRGGRR